MSAIPSEAIGAAYERLLKYAARTGNYLNPDVEFTKELIESLLVNQERYGYWACPCRLASGDRTRDHDIVCPCAYREPDVKEYGACYCALYVDEEIAGGRREAEPVPERRPFGK